METTLFVILINIVMLILLVGIVIFIFQYRRRKLIHEREKQILAEQHKLELLRARLVGQEQTMQFIGREIHDSVAQKLTLATIYVQKLEYENQYPVLTPQFLKISSVLNDSLEELRNLSRTLAESRFLESTLDELLAQEADRVNDTGICRARFESNYKGKLSVLVKSFLVRITQEFIQNSLKHSKGDFLHISLGYRGEDLELKASDNGIGFDPQSIQSGGIGLSSMKRRAHLVGGFLHLHSEPGKGTEMEIIIPAKNLKSDE